MCPKTPQKRDTRLKNEIGMNFGKKFPPPLTYVELTLRHRLPSTGVNKASP